MVAVFLAAANCDSFEAWLSWETSVTLYVCVLFWSVSLRSISQRLERLYLVVSYGLTCPIRHQNCMKATPSDCRPRRWFGARSLGGRTGRMSLNAFLLLSFE